MAHDRREEVCAEFADALWEQLSAADPGSDAQLILARTAIAAFAVTPENSGTDRLRDLLAGTVEGLRLDPQIRWSILRALAARDGVALDELEAEKQRDNTLTGAAEF